MGIKDLLVLWKEPVDILNEDPASLTNGMHVHTTVDLVLDQFIEETSYDTVNGIQVSAEKESARYYALPYLKVEGDWIMIDKMIAIRVSAGNSACGTLEKISDETYEWWSDETGKVDYGYTTLEVDGRLRKMTEEEKDYMIDYITYVMDCNRSEAEKYVVPYVILIQNLNAALPMTLIGLVLLVIPISILVITKSREKRNAAMMYQRPRDMAKPEGTYYEPDDVTTAPVAYGSTTYGTNTYGQNMYGSTESTQNTYSSYGNTGAAQNANPIYGGAGAAQNANPIYGNAGTAQNANPIYGGAGAAQNANPIYGNAGTTQNANPIYGNAGTTQNANPIYGNAGTTQNANPVYGNVEAEDPSGLSLEFLMRSDEERWRREHGGN
ncbi:MAG: hypothetical protein K2J95_07690 [Lachnospiraceae bacterium]|nr:hypothetical protein [Lachnospiraceae bacterium]